jgi:hypothetical protein
VIKTVRCGVDTLEATFGGEPDFWVAKELVARKTKAQTSNSPDPILLGRDEFFVMPKGQGLWQYVVRNNDMMLRFSLAKNMPPLCVKFLAQGLATRGVDSLWNQVVEIAAEMGLSPRNLTRIDVCADFQGWTPTYEEMRHVVCPASFRPVYPSVEHPETFQFGKGTVVCRLYNKTKEVSATNKSWWHRVWKLVGYDPELDVWRFEVQLRSNVLKERDCRHVPTALANLYGLFSYGLSWASVRTPTSDSNPRRWPEHPAWTALRACFAPTGELGRIRPVVRLMEYDAVVGRIAAYLASAGAALGSTDYEEVCGAVCADALKHLHNRREQEFCDAVEEKRRKAESGE